MGPYLPPLIALCTPPPNIDVLLKLGVGSVQARFMDRLLPEDRLVRWGGACSHMCRCLNRCGQAGTMRPLFPVSLSARGDRFFTRLRRLGVSTAWIKRYPGASGVNFVLEFADGIRQIIRFIPPALVGPQHYNLEAIRSSSALAINGSLDRAVLHAALAEADLARIPVFWNPSVAHFEMLREGLGRSVMLLHLNQGEGAALAGLPPTAAVSVVAEAVQRMTAAKLVVITCGATGAHGSDGGRPVSCPAPMLGERQTVTGLGDGHFALVTAALVRSGPRNPTAVHLVTALRWAASRLGPHRHAATSA
jgi:sugar/nucleoside kinase (ribokinase family)